MNLSDIDDLVNDRECAKVIYKLHLESQIELLETCIEHPTKPGYKRHDILDKIKQLKKLKNAVSK
jgi:hypothetical protein